MSLLSLAFVALPLAAAPEGVDYQITITGTVEYNQIGSGILGGIAADESATLSFRVNSASFINSESFPTRGYFIDPASWSLQFDNDSIGLEDPYSGFAPLFVLRDNDPAVDGFLVTDNVNGPAGVPLAQAGGFGAFEHNFRVTYPGSELSSLNIGGAVGTYDFTGLSVFNWTIDDGPFNPFGMLFSEMTIERIDFKTDIDEVSLTTGGTQVMTLCGGEAQAGSFYWIFGSVTGTTPGVSFGPGLNLPVNFDPYFNLTLKSPGISNFKKFRGQLDASGMATAMVIVPAGLDPSLVGVVLNHAYVAAEVFGLTDFTSGAVSLLLVP